MSQLHLDHMPPDPGPSTGWLYVCINAAGVFKPGVSRNAHTLSDRIQTHRKQALMWSVFTHRIGDYLQEEAALKELLKDYRIAGTEWFELRDVWVAATLCKFLEERGGDTRQLRRAIQRIIEDDPRFHV